MPDCLFCKIARHEIPVLVVREDEHTLAFLDVNPRAEGHTVVIPKAHAETLLDLPDAELGPLWLAVREVSAALLGALGPDGFTIGLNHGREAGQAVPHLHVHVIPRRKGDGGGSIHTIVNAPPAEPLAEIHRKIVQSEGITEDKR